MTTLMPISGDLVDIQVLLWRQMEKLYGDAKLTNDDHYLRQSVLAMDTRPLHILLGMGIAKT